MALRATFLAAAYFARSWAIDSLWLATTTIGGAVPEWETVEETVEGTACGTVR